MLSHQFMSYIIDPEKDEEKNTAKKAEKKEKRGIINILNAVTIASKKVFN